MNRRNFITTSGKLLATCGIASAALPLMAGSGPLRPGKRQTGIGKLGPEEAEILRMACLAPSGHNAQPWKVRTVSKRQWIIGTDKSRLLPAVDPGNREVMLSLGAFLENLVQAAGHYGYSLKYRVLTNNPMEKNILSVRLIAAKPVKADIKSLERRRTLRNGMDTGEISGEDFSGLISGLGTCCAFFGRESSGGKILSEGTVEANIKQAWREPAQKELSRWIRWSRSDIQKYRNGLTAESMEINGFTGWYVRHFYDSSSVLTKDFRERGIKMVRQQVESCGGWIVIASANDSVSALLETGRDFQRMGLRAGKVMVALHPMTQMLEEEPWRGTIAGDLKIGGKIQFIIRAGYVKSFPEAVSLRMPLDRILQG